MQKIESRTAFDTELLEFLEKQTLARDSRDNFLIIEDLTLQWSYSLWNHLGITEFQNICTWVRFNLQEAGIRNLLLPLLPPPRPLGNWSLDPGRVTQESLTPTALLLMANTEEEAIGNLRPTSSSQGFYRKPWQRRSLGNAWFCSLGRVSEGSRGGKWDRRGAGQFAVFYL